MATLCSCRHAMEEPDDLLGALRIEVGERFVQQQELRTADQRMCDEDSLLLAAREPADPAIGEIVCIDIVKYLFDRPALFLGPASDAELLRVESEGDEVTCSHGHVGVEHYLLGDVPEGSATLAVGRLTEPDGSGFGPLGSEDDPE